MLTLVIVSLVSAGIGAVVMVTLLHCRRSVQRRFSLFYVSLPTKFQSLFYSTAARNIPPISHTFQLSQFYDHERCYDIERERERDSSGGISNGNTRTYFQNTCARPVSVRLISKSMQRGGETMEARYGSAISQIRETIAV